MENHIRKGVLDRSQLVVNIKRSHDFLEETVKRKMHKQCCGEAACQPPNNTLNSAKPAKRKASERLKKSGWLAHLVRCVVKFLCSGCVQKCVGRQRHFPRAYHELPAMDITQQRGRAMQLKLKGDNKVCTFPWLRYDEEWLSLLRNHEKEVSGGTVLWTKGRKRKSRAVGHIFWISVWLSGMCLSCWRAFGWSDSPTTLKVDFRSSWHNQAAQHNNQPQKKQTKFKFWHKGNHRIFPKLSNNVINWNSGRNLGTIYKLKFFSPHQNTSTFQYILYFQLTINPFKLELNVLLFLVKCKKQYQPSKHKDCLADCRWEKRKIISGMSGK